MSCNHTESFTTSSSAFFILASFIDRASTYSRWSFTNHSMLFSEKIPLANSSTSFTFLSISASAGIRTRVMAVTGPYARPLHYLCRQKWLRQSIQGDRVFTFCYVLKISFLWEIVVLGFILSKG